MFAHMPEMMTPIDDPDVDLVVRLFTLHSPADGEVSAFLDRLRAEYVRAANFLLDNVPRSPDRTVAFRSLHRACMDAIFAAVAHQPHLAAKRSV